MGFLILNSLFVLLCFLTYVEIRAFNFLSFCFTWFRDKLLSWEGEEKCRKKFFFELEWSHFVFVFLFCFVSGQFHLRFGGIFIHLHRIWVSKWVGKEVSLIEFKIGLLSVCFALFLDKLILRGVKVVQKLIGVGLVPGSGVVGLTCFSNSFLNFK